MRRCISQDDILTSLYYELYTQLGLLPYLAVLLYAHEPDILTLSVGIEYEFLLFYNYQNRNTIQTIRGSDVNTLLFYVNPVVSYEP